MDERPPSLDNEECMQDLPALLFCDPETQTEITWELLDRIEAENEEMRKEKGKVAEERNDLSRESKKLQH